MKLIKINTDHYVVVDDSEIKEGDYCLMFDDYGNLFLGNQPQQYLGEQAGHHLNKGLRKITHSTQPLESVTNYRVFDKIKNFNKIKELSLQEVKELIGEVDMEQIAVDFAGDRKLGAGHGYPSFEANLLERGFLSGYNQALEDNKEKKYTEEDMKYMFECGRNFQSNGESTFTISILHIEPKTDWEVEFVDGKLKLK